MNSSEECNDCLCNLDKCHAECCKEFIIKHSSRRRFVKGQLIQFMVDDEDLLKYYDFHDCNVNGNIVSIILEKFININGRLRIFKTCKYLTSEDLCSIHESNMRPKICDYPTLKSKNTYLTKNCIYRRKIRK
jgi:hypothetical protein